MGADLNTTLELMQGCTDAGGIILLRRGKTEKQKRNDVDTAASRGTPLSRAVDDIFVIRATVDPHSTDMTDQHSLLPAPTDPPVITCKKCKAPLPDATWKNCDNCRRNRTESYNRWKKSAQLRRVNAAAAGSQTGRMDLSESPLHLR